jgi:hypothetical protein
MFLLASQKNNIGLAKATFRIWAGVVKPNPFNNSKTSSKFRLDFALSNSLRHLKAFAISFSDKPHLLMKKSMTRPLCGGVIDGGAVWEQRLRNVMWGFEVNASGSGEGRREINWRWDDNGSLLVISGFHAFK